jgi:PKD repeat protein
MTIKTFLLKFFCLFFVFVSLECFSQPLSPISPKNGIVINNDSILLRWNKLSNAQYYELKYTTDSTFINNITSINVGLQTAHWLSPLLSNTTYYWRVEANTGAATVIGQSRKFTNFKPTDLPGCALWLRADTGVTLNGSAVQGWMDASSNNFNIVQATTTAQPQLQTNTIAGFPSLSFDGNDILTINNFPFDVTNNAFVVAKKANAAVAHGNITSGNYFDFEIQSYRCAIKLGGVVGLYDAVNWSQISLKRKSGASKVFYNGIQSGITNTDGLNPITPGVFALGNRNPNLNSPSPFRGNICEIFINTTSMADVEFFNAQNYLLDKFTEDLNLGYDTVIANNFCSFTISANAGFTNFLWSTGDTTATILVSEGGQYVLQAMDLFNRIQTDTIVVSYPNFNQINSSVLCVGNQLNWNTNINAPYSFLWQDGSTQPNFNISQAGTYYVKVTDTLGCVLNSDTVNISIDYFADEVFIGNDTSLCTGNTIQLQQGADDAINYLWSNGTFNDSLLINSGGLFWVEVSNINNCLSRDSINIAITGIAPIADFVAESVCIGLPMYFNDLSSALAGDTLLGWEWNFNSNGDSSNSQYPSYLYANAGSYTVSLKVITQTGCASAVNKVVNVFNHPNPDFVVTNNCNAKVSSFVDVSDAFGGSLSSWAWNFNDMFSINNLDTGNQVSHEFSQAGVYNIELIVNTLEGCIDTLNKPILVKTSPVAAFEYTKLCVGDTVKFKDISLIPFPQQNIFREWIFNDTIIINSLFEPTFVYQQAGAFPVLLYIMASNGCRDTITTQIEITNHPNAGFYHNNACINSQTNFIDTSNCINCSVNNWEWTINNSVFAISDTANFIFQDTGFYEVNLSVVNTAGCESNTSQNVHIGNKPNSSFNLSELFGSPPINLEIENLSEDNLLYQWSFGNGDVSNAFEPVYTYQDTGEFVLNLIVSDLNGCMDSSSKTLKILPKKVDMAITDALISENDGYIYTELSIINLGTSRVYSFDILLNSNGFINNTLEKWEGILLPGERIQYQLKNVFAQPDNYNKVDFMCFKIQNIDQGIDVNDLNNEQCDLFESDMFQIASLFPNPVNDFIKLNLISPTEASVTIEIIDFKGVIVKRFEEKLNNGINIIPIETISLLQGVYNCHIVYNNQSFSKSFLKVANEK